MSVKVTSHTAEVVNLINNQNNIALRLFLEDVHKNANNRTPMKEGNLRKRVRKSVSGNKGEIEWDSHYAIYQENPRKRFKYTTPGTGPHFAENAVSEAMENLPSIISKVSR